MNAWVSCSENGACACACDCVRTCLPQCLFICPESGLCAQGVCGRACTRVCVCVCVCVCVRAHVCLLRSATALVLFQHVRPVKTAAMPQQKTAI